MSRQPLRVLISGASVAGPTAAYWLNRHGFAVTVVERMPLARVRTSGHAVDLFGPAMDVAEWTGVLPEVMDARTRTDIVSFQNRADRGVDVEMRRLVAGMSGRHVEIMRGQLATILYEATRHDVEYLFEDSVRTINQETGGVAVTFEHAPADQFDLVIGADGLHSTVRRLVFGPENQFRRFLGGYLAVATIPNYLDLDGRMEVWNAPARLAAIYPVHQTTTARASFLFRRDEELVIDHRDVGEQKHALHRTYGSDGWQVPRLLDEMDAADDFYFDSISQIVMDNWIKVPSLWSAMRATPPARPSAVAPASPSSAPTSWPKSWPEPAANTKAACTPTRTACARSPPKPAPSDQPSCPHSSPAPTCKSD